MTDMSAARERRGGANETPSVVNQKGWLVGAVIRTTTSCGAKVDTEFRLKAATTLARDQKSLARVIRTGTK
jgi:hypothetical protein